MNHDGSLNYLENSEEHSHSLILGAKRKYKSWSAGEENKMKSLLDLDITSRNLKKAVEDKENKLPSRFSFYNKAKRMKSAIGLSQTLVTKQELHTFFMEESSVPDNPEQVFIPDFYFDNNGEHFEFGALFTTGFFIETYLKSKKPWCLNIDFTYNLSTDEFIVLFFGATDELGFYHPFGWGLMNHENTRAVTFFLEWIRREASVAPLYIMADGASQITLAIEQVFPLSTRLMCSFHEKKNVKEHLTELRCEDPNIAGEIMMDLSILQAGSVDHETFISMYQLLVQKWTVEKAFTNEVLNAKIQKFFKYMEETWIVSKLSNWYQGIKLQSKYLFKIGQPNHE